MKNLDELSMQELGETSREFFSTPIGEYITARVGADLEELRDELEKIDPYSRLSRRRYVRVKTRLDAVRKANTYLVELYTMGTELDKQEVWND